MEGYFLTDRYLEEQFHIDKRLVRLGREADAELLDEFGKADAAASLNQMRVLSAMQKFRLSEAHFAGTTGYGYNDLGREVLEAVYADVFGQQTAIVRPQLISGTHAISTALFGNLREGDELLAVTGKPYDTLLKVIGTQKSQGSLIEHGIVYKEVPLADGGGADFDAIGMAITPKTKIAAIQRSKGYCWRRSFTVSEIDEIICFIKSVKKDVICFTDNCYGEFVDTAEPKADLLAGSLIKNPGGGLASVGGYITGAEEFVQAAACRLNTPGSGRDIGPSLGFTAPFLQGLFLAPQVVAGAVKGAVFAALMFEKLGFPHLPGATEKRSDIVQAAALSTPSAVSAFCAGVQKAAPVDSFVTPEAWEMPGYDCPVIMAAGAFVQGSSIELSADAPMRTPYIVYFQGGLSYAHSRFGVLSGLNEMLKKGCFTI